MQTQSRKPPSFRSELSRRWSTVALHLFAAVALAACGGGGGGGDSGQPQQNNTAPSVSAGTDQTITLPATAALTGSATDAQGQTLTYQWSGPAGVTFASATSAATTATFASAGTYTLTLTASDGSLTGSDSLVVTVNAAASAPTVSAGEDQTITLPNGASLAAQATDPEGDALTYTWTSDPAGVTFSDPAALSTTATFSAAGTYTLTLTATDGQTTGSDSVVITVNAPTSGLFWPGVDNDESVADHGWTRVTPQEVGMLPDPLTTASTYASAAGGAGMIVRGGRLVHSWATGTSSSGNPVTIDTRFPSQSTTKSIGGMALGIAIERGLIQPDLSNLGRSFLSTLGQPPDTNNTTWLDTVTLLQLATHSAGFLKPQGYPVLQYQPGTTFFYSDGGLNWLADALTMAFAEDLDTVLRTNIWNELGVNPAGLTNDDVQWRSNVSRPEPLPPPNANVARRELASGIQINANAMARVGLLYLRNGQWSSGQQVLPQSFVELSRTPQPDNADLENPLESEFPGAPTDYGVLWWTNSTCQMANVPSDAFWAWGQYDSLIVVIPSLDLVISRIGPTNQVATGRVFGEGDWTAEYSVLEPLLDPIVASTQPAAPICTP